MSTKDEPPEPHRAFTEQTKPGGSAGRAWRRLYRIARPRATLANGFALLLAALLGVAIVTQVRQTQTQGLDSLREDELVRILDDVTQTGNRLDDQVRDLERTRDDLAEGGGDSPEAIRAAQERADTLGILAGTERATGPGITLRIEDPDGQITSATVLDAVQELRDAGAEAIQIGDVRVVADTWFRDGNGGVVVAGHQLHPPYTITAIGDAHTMGSAMEIPGGVTASVRSKGGSAEVEQFESVNVGALRSKSSPRYAQPVPESSDDSD
ncbi:DUF881 domain-containing protein [Janibacter corallicola]|uniref:DUF881 domain-containing protein n=1 Tax=Janibacter corallicola TaxID=415212 RepID=UPI000833548D|nr:DUF881 domain-containing protein [Janibacter corallicola]